MKIQKVGAELFRAGGRTDRHDEDSSLANASKIGPAALVGCY